MVADFVLGWAVIAVAAVLLVIHVKGLVLPFKGLFGAKVTRSDLAYFAISYIAMLVIVLILLA